ncbi:MAG: NTP transferase domain-containing protein [Acetobacteraceae bacterium]|nr:NTP transferase domain-containing protein [Acetobacteraceae bacterium]
MRRMRSLRALARLAPARRAHPARRRALRRWSIAATSVPPPSCVRAGDILHFGMPVDPGNLLLLGRIGDIPAVVLPGCARSPKRNGVDWVLERLMADLPIAGRDIMALGVGGLLEGDPAPPAAARTRDARPRPRRSAPRASPPSCSPPAAPRASEAANKLLVRGARRAGDDRAHGGQRARLARPPRRRRHRPRGGRGGRSPRLGATSSSSHNPDHASGLASSIRAGIDAARRSRSDGALIVLGDMPLVRSRGVRSADRCLRPRDAGGEIVVPAHRGVRGNPVLFGARFFPALRALAGDVGARSSGCRTRRRTVHEVAVEDDGVLRDFDTPDALAAAPDLAGA